MQLVLLADNLRKGPDSDSSKLKGCEELRDSYDEEIRKWHRVAPATYVCAICGDDDTDHVHDSRLLSTYTLGCGHQACCDKLSGWLQSQLSGGERAAALRCPFRDPQTGTRCDELLSTVQEDSGISNLPQMLQELLPHDVSMRVFQQMAEVSPNLVFCPRSTCSAAWWLDDGELASKLVYSSLTCESCRLHFCCKCPDGPHRGKTCDEHQQALVRRRAEAT